MKSIIYSICIEKLHTADLNTVGPFIEAIRDEIDNYDYTKFDVVTNWGTNNENFIHFKRDLTQFVNKFRQQLLGGTIPSFDFNSLLMLLVKNQELTTSEEKLIETVIEPPVFDGAL